MNIALNKIGFFVMSEKVSRKFSQKSQKTKIIKAKLNKMITLVVDFHSSTTYLQSQEFLALVTTLKYFFQSVQKILSGPCISSKMKTHPTMRGNNKDLYSNKIKH